MKKIALLMALIFIVLPVTANAASPRMVTIWPSISFDGTTANCSVSITADSTNDEIEAVVKLWHGDSCIATWNVSGTGFLNVKKSKTVIKGEEYALTADITINGNTRPTVSTVGTCQ